MAAQVIEELKTKENKLQILNNYLDTISDIADKMKILTEIYQELDSATKQKLSNQCEQECPKSSVEKPKPVKSKPLSDGEITTIIRQRMYNYSTLSISEIETCVNLNLRDVTPHSRENVINIVDKCLKDNEASTIKYNESFKEIKPYKAPVGSTAAAPRKGDTIDDIDSFYQKNIDPGSDLVRYNRINDNTVSLSTKPDGDCGYHALIQGILETYFANDGVTTPPLNNLIGHLGDKDELKRVMEKNIAAKHISIDTQMIKKFRKYLLTLKKTKENHDALRDALSEKSIDVGKAALKKIYDNLSLNNADVATKPDIETKMKEDFCTFLKKPIEVTFDDYIRDMSGDDFQNILSKINKEKYDNVFPDPDHYPTYMCTLYDGRYSFYIRTAIDAVKQLDTNIRISISVDNEVANESDDEYLRKIGSDYNKYGLREEIIIPIASTFGLNIIVLDDIRKQVQICRYGPTLNNIIFMHTNGSHFELQRWTAKTGGYYDRSKSRRSKSRRSKSRRNKSNHKKNNRKRHSRKRSSSHRRRHYGGKTDRRLRKIMIPL